MEALALLADLHQGTPRQGPGGEAETERALALAGLDRHRPLAMTDIGCGTGASALVLARHLNAHITAVDFLPGFLQELAARAERAGLAGRITPLCGPMDALPFAAASLDAIWSEGAVYNIGFAHGVALWRRYLKPGGLLAVSELSWLTARRPADLERYWRREYAEIDRPSEKLQVLEDAGYTPVGYFALPAHCWQDNYYRPLQAGFDAFLARHGHAQDACDTVALTQQEIDLYEKYQAYFGYGFYIARKTAAEMPAT